MRLPLFITLLCMTLAASARAQTLNIAFDPPSPGSLTFNPTASGSPYPFRVIPLLSAPSGSACSRTDNFVPTDPDYNRCFKSFSQYFNPITPSSGGYDVFVTNCGRLTNTRLQMRFALTSNTTLTNISLAYTNVSLPASRIQYSVNGGVWNSVPTTLTNPLTGGYANITPDISRTTCTPLRVQVRFRLRLQGTESATGAD